MKIFVQALRADLAHYTLAALEDVLGSEAMAALRREQRMPALMQARALSKQKEKGSHVILNENQPCEAEQISEEKQRLALLARLLLLGDFLCHEEVEKALPALSASGKIGELIESCEPHAVKSPGQPSVSEPHTSQASTSQASVFPSPASFKARYQIVPVRVPAHLRSGEMRQTASNSTIRTSVNEVPAEVLIASDWGELAGQKPSEKHVMPVGGATRTLAALAVYTAGQRVLDVGTGCGVHAIFAALSGAEVTATDISPRALFYADLNAALNGVHIELREGSLAEPAEGLYDVVVSNPPFVITPQKVRDVADYQYRDGGGEGDSLLGELIADIPRILAPGGRAWLLGNWEICGDEWDEKPRAWVGNELEAWVIQREELTPAAYVEMWLRDGGLTAGTAKYEEMYQAWLSDFYERGVKYIGMGYLCLGATNSPQPWQRFERIAGPAPEDLVEHIESVWDQRDLLRLSSPEDLADTRPVVKGIEHRLYIPGAADPFMIKLAQIGGFSEEIQVTSNVAGVVGACDGELTLGDLCDALASITGSDSVHVRQEVLPAASELIAMGILRRVFV